MVGVASRWLRGLSANDGGEEWAEVGEPGVCWPSSLTALSSLYCPREKKNSRNRDTHPRIFLALHTSA
jgi:hypothetical protein